MTEPPKVTNGLTPDMARTLIIHTLHVNKAVYYSTWPLSADDIERFHDQIANQLVVILGFEDLPDGPLSNVPSAE